MKGTEMLRVTLQKSGLGSASPQVPPETIVCRTTHRQTRPYGSPRVQLDGSSTSVEQSIQE